MQDKLKQIKQEILNSLSKVKNNQALRNLEVEYLGRKGKFTKFLRGIAELNTEDKKQIGSLANEIKAELQAKFKKIRNIIDNQNGGQFFTDITLPGQKIEQGHLHPITIIQNELEDLFVSMGFMVLEGLELESDYFNFEALNIPAHHPARDMQDTFYVDLPNKNGDFDLVMRTHTSPMQVRAMLKHGAPLRVVVPGRVFRNEATDATHEHTLNQIEGIMIDKNISIVNLVAVLKEALAGIFKTEIKIRVRPGYFPFVEPGLEIDMQCTICGGKKCLSCKNSGWLEMLGAGMIHPKVLLAGGINPEEYSGFAFGIGIDRLVMMKYGIDDIRNFNSGDLRFLNQF